MMRDWPGVRSDLSATVSDIADASMGCEMAVNVSYYMDGQITRRAGLELAVQQSGINMIHYRNALTGQFVVFATSTGTLVAVSI